MFRVQAGRRTRSTPRSRRAASAETRPRLEHSDGWRLARAATLLFRSCMRVARRDPRFPRMPRGTSRPARFYLLAEFLIWTAHGVYSVLFNLYLSRRASRRASSAAPVSMNAIGVAVAAIPAGILAERWGRKRSPSCSAPCSRASATSCARRLRTVRRCSRPASWSASASRSSRSPRRRSSRALHAARAHAPVQHVLRRGADRRRRR